MMYTILKLDNSYIVYTTLPSYTTDIHNYLNYIRNTPIQDLHTNLTLEEVRELMS